MSGFLLDVNVVIALIDPSHVHHDRAHAWFASSGRTDWLSCPMTENAVVRVVSHPRYSNSQPPPVVMDSLHSLAAVGHHRFIPDMISILDRRIVDRTALLSSGQVTDTYLLALAKHHQASLATFDTRLVSTAVRSSTDHLLHVP